MKLTSDRLLLLPLIRADIPDIHALNSEREVARFNTIGIPARIADTEKRLKTLLEENTERTRYAWVIRLKETHTFIGEIGLNLAEERYKMCKMYYNLLPEFWGKGYATEAVMALLDFGFRDLKIHRMEAGCAVENYASIRVLEKVGMQKESRRRKVLPLQNGWSDNFEFAILDGDFK
jgi:RimJ/RimL family protein N-acetyltransferase